MPSLSRRSVLGGLGATTLVRPALAAGKRARPLRVEAANARGRVMLRDALSAPVLVGSIVTIAGVTAYNARLPHLDPTRLRQFVVTKRAEEGEFLLELYPFLRLAPARYANVNALPEYGAELRVVPVRPYTRFG